MSGDWIAMDRFHARWDPMVTQVKYSELYDPSRWPVRNGKTAAMMAEAEDVLAKIRAADTYAARIAWITANPWRARQVELVLADLRRRREAARLTESVAAIRYAAKTGFLPEGFGP